MAVFDLAVGRALRISASQDAFYYQFYRVWRRRALSGQPWDQLGGNHKAGEELYFGPLDTLMQYQILGFNQIPANHIERQSQERVQDNGETVVIGFEDGGDGDFNDLIVRARRETPLGKGSEVESLKRSSPGWEVLSIAEGFAAKRSLSE